MSQFSLFAQATLLLDRVFELRRGTVSEIRDEIFHSRVAQLERALNALLVFINMETSGRAFIGCCPSAICYRYNTPS